MAFNHVALTTIIFMRLCTGICSGTVRSNFHPSQKRCRKSAGAAQTMAASRGQQERSDA